VLVESLPPVEPPPFVESLALVEPLAFVEPLLLAKPADPSETVVVVAATYLAVWLLLGTTAATMATTMTAAALPQKIGF
jgi:hypothetical protein